MSQVGKGKRRELRCKGCNGVMEIDFSKGIATCPYCGSTETVEAVVESDRVKIERMRNEAKAERRRHELETAERQEHKTAIQEFKSGKMSNIIIGLAVFVILCAVGGFRNHPFSSIVMLLSGTVFAFSWLVGSGFIKKAKPRSYILFAFAGFALLLFALRLNSSVTTAVSKEELVWPGSSLGQLLPDPPVQNGKIWYEGEGALRAYAYDASDADYRNFVKSCESEGFTVDSKKEDYSFSAYDENGYFIELEYRSNSKTIDISIEASKEIKFTEFDWPKSKIVKYVPIPKSNIGTIVSEREDSFSISVGETSKEDYDEYVAQCYDAGFSIDYKKEDCLFEGDHKKHYHLTVRYEWNQTMYISVKVTE